jgi:hypothetical protein
MFLAKVAIHISADKQLLNVNSEAVFAKIFVECNCAVFPYRHRFSKASRDTYAN